MDEAASLLRMTFDSKPEELDRIDRQIIQLKIEQAALKKEGPDRKAKRLDAIGTEIAGLDVRSGELTSQWQAAKTQRLESASCSRPSKMPAITLLSPSVRASLRRRRRSPMHAARARTAADGGKGRVASSTLFEEEVSASHIAQVVSSWTVFLSTG